MSKLPQSCGLTYGLPRTGPVENARKLVVRMGRLELPRPCERWNLNRNDGFFYTPTYPIINYLPTLPNL
jgi:hypothetical protein